MAVKIVHLASEGKLSSLTPEYIGFSRAPGVGLIDAAGQIIFQATPAATGIYLDDGYLGFYNSTTAAWEAYMDNTGQFYLTGATGTGLSWNGADLTVDGTITGSAARFEGELQARALRTIPITITNANKWQYCTTHSGTSTATTPTCDYTKVYLDGSVNNGVAGTAGTYPDRVSTHVILDTDFALDTGEPVDGGDAPANKMGPVFDIIPPDLHGSNQIEIVAEIGSTATVEFVTAKTNQTNVGIGKSFAASGYYPAATRN